MKTKSSSAFTLIEIVTAMTVILILTGMVISIAAFVINKGNRTRCAGEIQMLSTALDSYKADSGRFPQDTQAGGDTEGVTDRLQTKTHFIPTERIYEDANIFLYKELTSDREGASGGDPDGIPEEGTQYWKDRNPNMVKADLDANKKVVRVRYIQDPWGFPYGYSTIAAFKEHDFQKKLKNGEKAERLKGDALTGFNTASFDLWSTGNSKPASQPSSNLEKDKLWAKWIKNW